LKPLNKYILLLTGFEILVLLAGYLLTSNLTTDINFSEILYLSVTFTLLAMMVLIIFFRGQSGESASQAMHLLVSIGLKFLSELIIAFIWFFVAKKTGLASVILFFILYLAFTLFSLLIVVKTLKYKPI
jgi:hypothetical protein